MSVISRILGFCLLLVLGGCVSTVPPADRPRPDRMFVVAANPLAADAGMAVLRRGGSAVDAAIAVEAMLSLVEPQSSGLGGGAFLTRFDSATGKVDIYDGRETAPAGASADMFLDDDGQPIPFRQAVVSGRATGVPGVVRMLALAHREHGRLQWSELFDDARRTALEGFAVSPRMARIAGGSFPQTQTTDVRAYFRKPDGSLIQAGDRLRNPAYAEFLGRLAAQGPDALYRGPTAQRIVERTRAGPLGGTMTLADLESYRPVKRDALCAPYRIYRICVPPPPSSGVGLLQLLAMLERTDIAAHGPSDPAGWFLFAEASRLMYSDRDQYVGDPAFVAVPVAGLLDPAYVARRASLIGPVAGPPPTAGNPPGAPQRSADRSVEPIGTTYFIIGDKDGNVVSMTATVESIYGSGRMVDGFFLNNELTDFSFAPLDRDGRKAANAVAPGKRPRSSMTPLVMIGPDGKFAGALGSAGGNAILAYVGKSLVAAVDWGLHMQQAIALPNLVARGGNFQGEIDKFPPVVLDGLAVRGAAVSPGQGEDSGLTGVFIRNGHFEGGADPRREGVVRVEPVR